MRLRHRARRAAPAADHLRDDGRARGGPRRRSSTGRTRSSAPATRSSARRFDVFVKAAMDMFAYAQQLGEDRLDNRDDGPDERDDARRRRRRAADDAGVRVVLHPARRRRQRDDAQRDQPRHARADAVPRAAHDLVGRLRREHQDRGRRDGALGVAGDLHAPRGHRGHRDQRHQDRGRRQGVHVLQLGQPGRDDLARRLHVRRAPPRRSRRRPASAPAARTSASAPTSPVARSA